MTVIEMEAAQVEKETAPGTTGKMQYQYPDDMSNFLLENFQISSQLIWKDPPRSLTGAIQRIKATVHDVAPLAQELCLDAPATTLFTAAELIDRYGWVQGHSFAPGRGMCAHGAMIFVAAAIKGSSTFPAANQRLMEHLDVRSIVTWNDSPNRSKREVVQALREAALNGSR